MNRYVINRLLLLLPTLWLVTLFVFFGFRLVPGDVIDAQFSEVAGSSPEVLAEMRHKLGLDQPAYVQYFRWIGGALRGDLGASLVSNASVAERIAESVPVSAELAILSIMISISIALPVGIIAAIRQNTWLDYLGRTISIAGLATPSFVTALLLMVLPALWFYWTPPLGYANLWDKPLLNLQQVLPAAVALGANLSAVSMRMTRSTMLEVLREDYVRTARSKGLHEQVVVLRHVLRNALVPVVTVWGSEFGVLLGGTVIIESIFGLPGVGLLTLQAITNRDYAQMQGNVVFLATVFVMVNLAVDLIYGVIDPRIRYS